MADLVPLETLHPLLDILHKPGFAEQVSQTARQYQHRLKFKTKYPNAVMTDERDEFLTGRFDEDHETLF